MKSFFVDGNTNVRGNTKFTNSETENHNVYQTSIGSQGEKNDNCEENIFYGDLKITHEAVFEKNPKKFW